MIDDETIQTFVEGFCFTRSFTHPYQSERIDGLWVMRDGPRTSGDYRTEEWVSHGISPEKINSVARAHSTRRFAVCCLVDLNQPFESLKAGMEACGYRLQTTEPMMVHALKRIPSFESPASIVRVRDQQLADRLAKMARSRQMLPEHFREDASLRQYVALLEDQIVGWVKSIQVRSRTWCSSMYVQSSVRRQGIGRALLSRMLRDDRAAGSKQAVLLASHTGAKLYPVVGYEQLGTLLLFSPKMK